MCTHNNKYSLSLKSSWRSLKNFYFFGSDQVVEVVEVWKNFYFFGGSSFIKLKKFGKFFIFLEEQVSSSWRSLENFLFFLGVTKLLKFGKIFIFLGGTSFIKLKKFEKFLFFWEWPSCWSLKNFLFFWRIKFHQVEEVWKIFIFFWRIKLKKFGKFLFFFGSDQVEEVWKIFYFLEEQVSPSWRSLENFYFFGDQVEEVLHVSIPLAPCS